MKATMIGALLLAFGATTASAAVPPGRVDPALPAATVAQRACAQCHAADGMATVDGVPDLAGQHARYLSKQLHDFKRHGRRDPAGVENMWAIAHDLGERQIDELAHHFAALPPLPQPLEGSPDQIAAGASVYTSGAAERGVPACAGCHGAHAEGQGATPRLAGQHMTYLVKQLMVFQRTNARAGTAMSTLAHELTAANIENVAAYLQALPHAGKL